MKIFVTGATGFIGSNFVSRATQLGHRVFAQKRPESKINSRLEVEWIEKNLNEDFHEELIGADALVHFAAHTPNAPYDTLSECSYWNVTATLSLLEQAAAANVGRMILAGTCFEYGASAHNYQRIPPGAPLQPYLSYPVSKAAATIAACGLAREKNLHLQVLRIFQAYGEGEQERRFWPSLRKAALAGEDFNMSAGTQIRDFIHVSDVCDAFISSLNDKTIQAGRPSIRNVGTGHGSRLIDFAADWWTRWDAKGKLIPGSINQRPGELERVVAEVDSVYYP